MKGWIFSIQANPDAQDNSGKICIQIDLEDVIPYARHFDKKVEVEIKLPEEED